MNRTDNIIVFVGGLRSIVLGNSTAESVLELPQRSSPVTEHSLNTIMGGDNVDTRCPGHDLGWFEIDGVKSNEVR